MYQTFVYHYMIMTRFYCHRGSYGKIVEHKCPMSWPWCVEFKGGYGLQFLISFFFHFLYKLIILLQFFSIFRIWVRDFVCKLSVLLRTIALSVDGCLCNFLFAGKSRNKEKKKELVFCKEEDKENNSWAPLLFPSPSFLYAILFLYNNFDEE